MQERGGHMPVTTATLTLPRSIYIEPTSRCNELCQQCPRTLLSREDDRDLSFDDFRSIVDQFPELERVVLHGLGEPLLNKDLPRMIHYLIPISVLRDHSKMGEVGHRTETFRVGFQLVESTTHLVNNICT